MRNFELVYSSFGSFERANVVDYNPSLTAVGSRTVGEYLVQWDEYRRHVTVTNGVGVVLSVRNAKAPAMNVTFRRVLNGWPVTENAVGETFSALVGAVESTVGAEPSAVHDAVRDAWNYDVPRYSEFFAAVVRGRAARFASVWNGGPSPRRVVRSLNAAGFTPDDVPVWFARGTFSAHQIRDRALARANGVAPTEYVCLAHGAGCV